MNDHKNWIQAVALLLWQMILIMFVSAWFVSRTSRLLILLITFTATATVLRAWIKSK